MAVSYTHLDVYKRQREGEPLEIFTDREGQIILKKYSPIGELGTFAKQYAEAVSYTHLDFVEIKNSVIGEGTKISHLTYVGDADVGKNINFGCGTVLVNYDGKEKHRSVIEDHAFIGCNTNLVSPVRVGEGAFIAAGSTITSDVPPDALGIARARQVNKEDWVQKRGKR